MMCSPKAERLGHKGLNGPVMKSRAYLPLWINPYLRLNWTYTMSCVEHISKKTGDNKRSLSFFPFFFLLKNTLDIICYVYMSCNAFFSNYQSTKQPQKSFPIALFPINYKNCDDLPQSEFNHHIVLITWNELIGDSTKFPYYNFLFLPLCSPSSLFLCFQQKYNGHLF